MERMTYDFSDVSRGVTFQRFPGSPPMPKESTLWYHVCRLLRYAGYGVVRQVPERDGHMTSAPYYIREQRGRWYLYDAIYAVRDMAAAFNSGEPITLSFGGGT